ncbi:bifunctional nicotinamidase/pyrazinamidase [Rhodobacter lacus]|uniref:nicotinamidase n=1 Tax=Rhodobacter lacus TaxID=1641972 RepID=A0ABW5ADI4_9RHOB
MAEPQDALIVIDIQNDFCPGGALAVAGGDEILPQVNALMAQFPVSVLTQDWHPENHSSFAANHPGAAPFSQVPMPYGMQTLWPSHCVQGSEGADFHPGLDVERAELILRKGFRPGIDSYSAFFENDRSTATGLAGYLRERGITRLTFVGLALDFCVGWSALDAARLGFEVRVIESACRAIDLDGSLEAARAAMRAAGVELSA